MIVIGRLRSGRRRMLVALKKGELNEKARWEDFGKNWTLE